jgi:hypothetical protein
VKPRCKNRAAAAKQSVSTAVAKVDAVKTTEKKKRKRKTSLPPEVGMLGIPTPLTRVVDSDDEEEDEATDDPPVVEERTVRRPTSPAVKR